MSRKMKYPVKYIENNLVFNHDNEVFAYYELVPYNYSFLSPEQKLQIHESFRQLVAQSREGKIHALQIATESSVRTVQEKSKEEVTGKLKQAAYLKIDRQTDALVSEIGENQIDYRFFIGFKLMTAQEEISLENLKKTVFMNIKDFFYEVNHNLMGDFVSMDNDEINRFQKMESLLKDKITRRFKIRRLNEHDFGYLIEHVHGQSGVPYETYQYHLPKIKLKEKTQVKKYDLMKPERCKIRENQRYLTFEREDTKSHAAYFAINEITSELNFPSSEIFYYQQGNFEFPVDTSMNVEILPNRKALNVIRNKKKELNDLDNHAYQSNSETPDSVAEALEDAGELEADLGQTKESMYKLSYVIRVSADSKEELKRRCDVVKDFYDDANVKLVRPFGDMLGLHGEFLPASKRYLNDYVQYVTSDFLAGLGFGATQMLGEKYGIYIGFNIETDRNVYIRPSLAAQGIKGTVTNALAMAFLGAQGGGKSFANNIVVYYVVQRGGKVLIIDPKGERGEWIKTLPDIAEEINIIRLTNEEQDKGMLDPYVIMKDIKDAESLAIDQLTFLTNTSIQDEKRFPVLLEAIHAVSKRKQRGLLFVIEELRKKGSETARLLANHIESYTKYDLGQLLFSDGTVENSISFEKQLNIIQVEGLVLPEKGVEVKDYVAKELLSVAMLIGISTFSLDFIHSDRSIFKVVDLDEAWSFLNVAQGKTLSNKLVRAGRAMNAGIYFVTQNTDDLQDEKIKNAIGMKFAFRSTDMDEIKHTLKFFGLDPEDEGNQKQLSSLENGQCLFQDLYGRMGVIQIEVLFPELFEAFDTRPPKEKEEEE